MEGGRHRSAPDLLIPDKAWEMVIMTLIRHASATMRGGTAAAVKREPAEAREKRHRIKFRDDGGAAAYGASTSIWKESKKRMKIAPAKTRAPPPEADAAAVFGISRTRTRPG